MSQLLAALLGLELRSAVLLVLSLLAVVAARWARPAFRHHLLLLGAISVCVAPAAAALRPEVRLVLPRGSEGAPKWLAHPAALITAAPPPTRSPDAPAGGSL